MPKWTCTPNHLITGVEITDAQTEAHIKTLCKTCYCVEYEMDESSVSTATTQPQPDMQVEHHRALTCEEDEICDHCKKQF